MRRVAPTILAFAVACARSPEAEVAEQPTVEIPEAQQEETEEQDEADDVPVPSNPDRAEAREAEIQPPEEEEAIPEPHGGLPPPGMSGAYSGPTGGPDCQALADCCLKSLAFAGGAPDPRMCNHLRTFPAMICAQLLPQMQKEALKHGIQCGP